MSRRKTVFGIMASAVTHRRSGRGSRAARSRAWLIAFAVALPSASFATSIVPISDSELLSRADAVVRGVVLSSEVREDGHGRPETVTTIRALEVLKGAPLVQLVLRQPGGELPDGRFFELWGRPEYVPGREVIVFAIALPDGDYQTAEMLLGKFEVWKDAIGRRFAVPDLTTGVHPGVGVIGEAPIPSAPRELARFRSSLRHPTARPAAPGARPVGSLTPIVHADKRVKPKWGNINNQLWRWNNNATAAWTLSGTANIDGGGTAEAQGALAAWTNDPNSNIAYSQGSGTSNVIYLNATSSALGCGWSTCLSGAGVIGCGGPSGGGNNSWRGDSYHTIMGGTVELRAYCTHNLYSSVVTQSVIEHELGHTLGLGHSDQNVSPHDACRGDESAAIMRSTAQSRTSLGTDDQDAIRWIYGDGGNFCTSAPAPVVNGILPATGGTGGGTSVTITGSNFVPGAAVTIGGVAAVGVNVSSSTSITASTGPHGPGAVGVTVTNPDGQSGSGGSFTYVCATPTAVVGGGGLICGGSAAQVQAVLTGNAPWSLTWSDGFVQSGVASSPAIRAVSPSVTTTYTVASLTDAYCAGSSSGSAPVTVVSCAGGLPSGTLLPDGRSVQSSLSASGNSYEVAARTFASYAVEVEAPFNGSGTVPGGGPAPLLSITRADDTPLAADALDRTSCSAVTAARLTFTPSAADLSGGPLQVHVTDPASSGYLVRIRVVETTLYGARWSRNGYSSFIDIANTCGCSVSGQVELLDDSGALVTILSFSLGSGGATQLPIPSGLSASSGSAALTHDGPPGAITAGVYMTGASGAAFRWQLLPARSYGD